MEEEKIRQKARQEVEEIWENELKKSFDQQIQTCLKETLISLKGELSKYESAIKSQIQEFDKQFDEKWNKRFKEGMSQIEQIQKQKKDEKKNEFKNEINNKEKNEFNNEINNKEEEENNFNIINEDDESDEALRKKQVNLNDLNKPPLINLILEGNYNPLINIVLESLINIKDIFGYYLNPIKEEKILKKSKDNPNNTYLDPSFLKLLDHFWKSNKNEYSTSEIHDILKKLMLNNYNTHDFGVIFNFILSQLNDEISFNPIINKEPEDVFDYFDEKKRFQSFLLNFKNAKTVISDNFYSSIKFRKECQMYLSDVISFEGVPVINLYLESFNEGFNDISLIENLKTLLNKDNNNTKVECKACHEQHDIFVGKDIFSTTTIVIININREKDPNNNINFDYPEEFDGKKVINDSFELPKYELINVIKKEYNEYISYYKSFINNQWYAFNNKKISSLENKNIIYDKKNTCLLIYRRIKINN